MQQCTENSSTKIVLRAITSLTEALRSPFNVSSSTMDIQDKIILKEERHSILNIIDHIVQCTKEPLILQQIQEKLDFYKHPSFNDDFSSHVKQILRNIKRSLLVDLYQVLIDPWQDYRLNSYTKEALAKSEIKIKNVARRFLRQYRDVPSLVNILEQCLKDVQQQKIKMIPNVFFGTLAQQNQNLALGIIKYLIKHPESPITESFSSILYEIKKIDSTLALSLMQEAVKTKNHNIGKAIANGYSWGGLYLNMTISDVEIIKCLCEEPMEAGRRDVIQALRRFPIELRKNAKRLIIEFDTMGDSDATNKLCSCINAKHGIPPDDFSNEDLEMILNKIFLVIELRDHLWDIGELIKICSERIPDETISMFIRRLKCIVNDKDNNEIKYWPFPTEGLEKWIGPISGASMYTKILCKIRNESILMLDNDRSWLPKLFCAASDNFGSTAINVLHEWIENNDPLELKAVAYLVSDAPRNFVFDKIEFVAELLEKAFNIGDDVYKDICSYLYKSAVYHSKSGSPGQPFPEDIEVRDKSKMAIDMFPIGSPTWQFYNDLINAAKSDIKHTIERNEEMADN